jgi:FKBP-type peptidyl-prolyl cis-trans isomerase SlyD
MKIGKNTVVTVEYTLSDAQGNVIEKGNHPMVYLHGGYENTIPKIEAALDGQKSGFKTEIQLEPEDAFGDYDAELLRVEPRSRFPGALEVGMQFEGIPDGEDDSDDEGLIFMVTDIAEDKVVLDGNHPFAGMALRFGLHVTEVRVATAEEIQHEHVHGSYGHHHEEEDDDDDVGNAYRTHVFH